MVILLVLPIQTFVGISVFDLQKAQSYIKSQYNASLGLVRENEHIEKYWLWSDNELAAIVLRDYAPAISGNITSSVLAYKEVHGIEFRSAYGAILGKDTAFLAPINKNITDQIWYTDFSGDGELQCTDYADIAFLKAIYYYKTGDYAKSTECYLAGQRMFDGTGFKDKAYTEDGDRYSTYKVALWKIAADLARGDEVDVAKRATEILQKMQDDETGGVYTHYKSGLIPDSQTNTETTSLTIIAFDSSLLEPKTPLTMEQLKECMELGIEEQDCADAAIVQKRIHKIPVSNEERPKIVEQQNQINNSMYMVGIGAAIASIIAFITLRRRK